MCVILRGEQNGEDGYFMGNAACTLWQVAVSPDTINVYLHLGKLGGSSAGNFGHTELRQFIFQVVQLLQQLLFLLAPQVSCLDLGLNQAPFARH